VQLRWTLPDLVAEVAAQIAALPAPRNGQVRAVPDDRTVRYYAAIGLLDRPLEMRGRTALYGQKHVAQIVAIKRLQTMGRSLSEIQQLWPTLDDAALARMSGVAFTGVAPTVPRGKFWKLEAGPEETVASRDPDREPPREVSAPDAAEPGATAGAPPPAVVRAIAEEPPGDATARDARVSPSGLELRVELARNVVLSLSIVDDSVTISPADVRALRAAAAPLLAELGSASWSSPRTGSTR
jgi:DNA-binding transcriptional MerR regulator